MGMSIARMTAWEIKLPDGLQALPIERLREGKFKGKVNFPKKRIKLIRVKTIPLPIRAYRADFGLTMLAEMISTKSKRRKLAGPMTAVKELILFGELIAEEAIKTRSKRKADKR